ncbi:MAG: YHS domain-containing protein, partial [Bradyrhizobium sp.]|nr:YHS domain-containing protein [Bradyrhizobium sp.]
MTDARNANTVDTAKGSGCGCGSKTKTAVPKEVTKTGCCDGGGHDHTGHADTHAHSNATVRDPVCGMSVDPATSQHRFDYQSETHHFCSAGCRTKFAADPKGYLDKTVVKAEVPEGAIYTCP